MYINYQTLAQYVPDHSTSNRPTLFTTTIDFQVDNVDVFGTVDFNAVLSDDGVYSDVVILFCHLTGATEDKEYSYNVTNETSSIIAGKIEQHQEKLIIQAVD